MTPLQRRAYATLALAEGDVQSIYEGTRPGTAEQNRKALCASHERLRLELQGAAVLMADLRGEIGSIVVLLDEVATVSGDSEQFRLCRDRLRAAAKGVTRDE